MRLIRPILLLICLSFTACPRLVEPLSDLTGTEIAASDKEALLSSLTKRTQEIRSLRLLTDVQVTHDDERVDLRYVFLFEQPDRLRIEVLPRIGAYTLSLLVARAGETLYLDQNEKRAYRGLSDGSLVFKFLKVALRESDLMALLVGRVPARYLSPGLEHFSSVRETVDGGSYILSSLQGEITFLLDSKTLLLKEVYLLGLSGEVVAHVRYGDENEQGGAKIPGAFSIELFKYDVLMNFKASNFKLNQNIPEKLFEATVPGDYYVS